MKSYTAIHCSRSDQLPNWLDGSGPLFSRYGIYNVLVKIINSFQRDGAPVDASMGSGGQPTGISGEFWDPFDGKAYIQEDSSLNNSAQSYFPAFFANISSLLLPIGLAGFLFGILSHFDVLPNHEIFVFGGFAIFGVSLGLILLSDSLAGGKKETWKRLKQTADRLQYALRVDLPQDRLSKVRASVGEFFRLRVASAIPLHIDCEMWGFSKKENIPLWIGLSLTDSVSIAGGPAAQTVGRSGNFRGKTLMFIIGYRLDRDAGVRVNLFPEINTPLGPLDIDITTESVVFNSKYNIRLTRKKGGMSSMDMSADLLRVLTPALQDKLIGLADQYSARIIIDGHNVFFAGYHNLVSDDQNELDQMIDLTLDASAQAAVSFKRFAE